MTANLNTIFQSHENVTLRSYFDSHRRVINTGKLCFVNDIFAHSNDRKKVSCYKLYFLFHFKNVPCISLFMAAMHKVKIPCLKTTAVKKVCKCVFPNWKESTSERLKVCRKL